MRVCPKCNTQYTDLSLRFCLQDGAALRSPTEKETEQFNADEFSAAETVAVEAPRKTLDKDRKTTAEELVSSETLVREVPVKKEKRRSGFLLGLAVGLALLVLTVAAGAAIWFLPFFWEDNPKPKIVDEEVSLQRADFSSVSASSTRKKDGKITYSPENAFDNDETTAWCEGVRGEGKGEWVRVDFEKPEEIVEIRIKPGYFKNTTVWKKNNRVASIKVLFSEGTERTFEFPDSPKERVIEIPKTKANSVKITVEDIYPGSADRFDTLITDIRFKAMRKVEKK